MVIASPVLTGRSNLYKVRKEKQGDCFVTRLWQAPRNDALKIFYISTILIYYSALLAHCTDCIYRLGSASSASASLPAREAISSHSPLSYAVTRCSTS